MPSPDRLTDQQRAAQRKHEALKRLAADRIEFAKRQAEQEAQRQRSADEALLNAPGGQAFDVTQHSPEAVRRRVQRDREAGRNEMRAGTPEELTQRHSRQLGLEPGSVVEIELQGADELIRQRMVAETIATLKEQGFTEDQAVAAVLPNNSMPSNEEHVRLVVPNVKPPKTLADVQQAMRQGSVNAGQGAREFVRNGAVQPVREGTGSAPTPTQAAEAVRNTGRAASSEAVEATLHKGQGIAAITAVVRGVMRVVEGPDRSRAVESPGLEMSARSSLTPSAPSSD